MVNQIPTQYQISNPSELMEKIYTVGNNLLRDLRNTVTTPEERKKPRTWGATEAAQLIGVSNSTFTRLLEAHPELPGIVIDGDKHKRWTNRFTLEAINALRDHTGLRYVRPKGSSTLVIAVSNLKGGVGKTQTAVDLAKKIAIEGLRVLLLDFDAQGTATLLSSGLIPDLELDGEQTIGETLLSDPSRINNIILKTHFDGFEIIPANLAIQDCDLSLPNGEVNNFEKLGNPANRLQQSLDLVKEKYDVILIDCGPNLGALTINALVACNGIIIPIPPNMSDYSSFIMYTGTLNKVFDQLKNKKLEYLRILLSKHNGNNEALKMEQIMRHQFGDYVLANHMCDTVEVAKATNDIGTVYDIVKPRGSKETFRRAIQHLNDVNNEVINDFKEIWKNQSKNAA